MKSIILGVGVLSMLAGAILLATGNDIGILLLTLGCLSAISNKQRDETQISSKGDKGNYGETR